MRVHSSCLWHPFLLLQLAGVVCAQPVDSGHVVRRPTPRHKAKPGSIVRSARHQVVFENPKSKSDTFRVSSKPHRPQVNHHGSLLAHIRRARNQRHVQDTRVVAVEPGAFLSVPAPTYASLAHDLAKLGQVPTLAPAVAPLAVAPTLAPAAAAPLAVAPAAAAPLAPTAAPALAATTAAAAAAAPAAEAAAAGNSSSAGNKSGNDTAAEAAPADSPPYLQGPMKILVYGFFFATIYLLIWYARLPPENRPAAVDEGLMRWIESQEEEDPGGAVNCMLVRVKKATGLPADKQPAAVSVECYAFKKQLNIGETDFESNGVWDTCFVGPLVDQDQSRPVTMATASPQVVFIVRHQAVGETKSKDFAQATMKAGAASGSSSSAAAGGGGLTAGQWCTMDLKLTGAGGGAMGMLKGMAAGNLGTISVEAKAMNVNAAGKALLKSNYYVIAMRNEFKKPYSACARTLAVAIMGMLFLTSLPFIGDMFNGCFYLSCHGLTAAASLFAISIPHWAKLFMIPLPSWVDAMNIGSLKTAGAVLWSSGSSGVMLTLWWGRGEACTDHFFMLEILLVVDSLLFTVAWWKGEGGGLMGALMA